MPTATPTAAPPSFYDNLPAGGDAAAGGPAPKKPGADKDADEELMKGVAGCYRVVGKIGKAKKGIEPFVDAVKTALKKLAVEGLKMDPKDLEGGDDGGDKDTAATPPPAASPSGAPPTSTDESHAA